MKISDSCFIFDFDSTIVTEESLNTLIMSGVDDVFEYKNLQRKIEEISCRGMSGELSMNESLNERIHIRKIRKEEIEEKKKEICEALSLRIEEVINLLQGHSVPIFIISGGLIDFIVPVAEYLNIPVENCFGNSLVFDEKNQVIGFDEENPLTGNNGKSTVIRQYIKPKFLDDFEFCMVGDGVTDFEPFQAGVVNHFIGFGVNVRREKVEKLAIENNQPYFENMEDFTLYMKGFLDKTIHC